VKTGKIQIALSDNSPYFFIKEFSSEELTKVLVNKVRELRASKEKAEELKTRRNTR
jgi:hypothetical protein